MDYEKVYSYCKMAQDEAGIMRARFKELSFQVSHFNPPIPRDRMAVELQQALSAHSKITELMDKIASEIAGK